MKAAGPITWLEILISRFWIVIMLYLKQMSAAWNTMFEYLTW